MKLIIIACAAIPLLLTGCVAQNYERSAALSSFNGISYSPWRETETITAYKRVMPVTAKNKDSIARCVAKNVANSDIALTGSSSTYVGASTGKIYNFNKESKTGGGDVIQHISENGSVISKGNTDFSFSSEGGLVSVNIEKSVRFTLDVSQSDNNGTTFEFTNLATAQKSTGYMANGGYDSQGIVAMKQLYPEKALRSLDAIVDGIALCIAQEK